MGQSQIPTHIPPFFPFPSWILFDEKNFEGDQHILSEGEFPTLTAMGCLASTVLGSLQKVPLVSHLVWVKASPEAAGAAGSQVSSHCGRGCRSLEPVFVRTAQVPLRPWLQRQFPSLEIYGGPTVTGPGDAEMNQTQPCLPGTHGHTDIKMTLQSGVSRSRGGVGTGGSSTRVGWGQGPERGLGVLCREADGEPALLCGEGGLVGMRQ